MESSVQETLKFTMPFEPATIEHLGLRLYSYLPRVVAELVSNAWDAGSKKVEIILPEGDITLQSEVIIRDYGRGMDKETIQNEYLPIGRNCREEIGDNANGRPVMGRKGIGKLSAFGAANIIEVRTVRNGQSIGIRLNYEKMKKWEKEKPKTDYEPDIASELTGSVSESNGTEIRIRELRRKTPINKLLIRKELARRFSVICDPPEGDNFEVYVNGDQIKKEDRRLKEDCKQVWDVSQLPLGSVVDQLNNWTVSGWIGLVAKSSQSERGVDVFARGKVAEIETMFKLDTTHIQFARAYVVGEIHAEFLDNEEDNISTARDSINWETEVGQKLAAWGQTSLKFIFRQWLESQRKEKEEKIVKTADFDKWLSSRTTREQRTAKKLIDVIVGDEKIDPESAGPLIEMIKVNVEFEAFRDLVDDIGDSGADLETILKLFNDWRLIEAREHLKLSDGRLEIMEQLSKYIEEGALEVKQIQPLFEDNGWLVNPAWGDVSGQTTYTGLLRKTFKEPPDLEEENRRIDLLGYEVGGTLHVVEIKRPQKTLTWDDLEQIERYVTWARTNLNGTDGTSVGPIRGLLIVGKLSGDATVKRRMTDLAGRDIRVTTFRDLHHVAEKVFGEVEKRLKQMAPEYSRESRKKRKKE